MKRLGRYELHERLGKRYVDVGSFWDAPHGLVKACKAKLETQDAKQARQAAEREAAAERRGLYSPFVGLAALLVCLLLLAACQGGSPAANEPAGPVTLVPADTIQPTLPPAPTETLLPTLTPAPVWTVTPMPTPSLTATPTATPYPSTIELGGIKMALIPAGVFQMGSSSADAMTECLKFRNDCSQRWFEDEEPVHSVYLDAFYMDVYEVTNARYQDCVDAGVCRPPSEVRSYNQLSYYGDAKYAEYPVIYVSWDDAVEFCQWRGGRLPTEAEWEKAARGGLEDKRYPWGDEVPTCERANYGGEAGDCVGETTAVGSYAANGYGLYDMAGNVWEWTADWYGGDYYSQSPERNPSGPASGEERARRGGSWHDIEFVLRSAYRNSLNPNGGDLFFGFRCAVSAEK